MFDLGLLTPKIYSPKFGHKIAYKSACTADRPDMFGPTRGPTLVAIATNFGLARRGDLDAYTGLIGCFTVYCGGASLYYIVYCARRPSIRPT